jgi:hypothetical protein
MMTAHASWGEWVAVFERVYADPGLIGSEACPTCGAHTLHLVFTGDEDDRIGYASFWCSTSMDGIFTSRLHIPPGADMIPFGLQPEERAKIVPGFYYIPPAPIEGDDEESFTL